MPYIELDATLSCDEKEEFHDENLEGLETKDGNSVCLANCTQRKLRFVFTMTTIRKKESSEKRVTIGVQPAVLGIDLQANKGKSTNQYEDEIIEMNVYPHRQVDVPFPPVKSLLTMNGAECLANRTIKVTIHVEKAERGDEEVSVQSVVAGHGLIISEDKDIMVDQARGRKWFRSFKPWTAKSGRNMEPHRGMDLDQICEVCRFET